jgi:chromate reductase, NAD(P)H dehydrogenase (quinone)
MTTVVAISGSLREKSYNSMLMRAAAGYAPEGTIFETATIKDIPVYDGDVEAAHGIPVAVAALKDRVAAADGLLLVTPEYNNSIPGPFKNAIDWMSRPPADAPRVFAGRVVGVIGASLGAGGSGLSQAAWLPVFRTLGMVPFFGARLQVANAAKVFDDSGAIVDDPVRAVLEKYVARFAQFVAQHKAPR